MPWRRPRRRCTRCFLVMCCAAAALAACPGFRERLLADLRPLVPDDMEVSHCLLSHIFRYHLSPPRLLPKKTAHIQAEGLRAAITSVLSTLPELDILSHAGRHQRSVHTWSKKNRCHPRISCGGKEGLCRMHA